MAVQSKKDKKNNPAGGVDHTPKPTNTLENLHTRLADIAEKSKDIQNTADAEGRALNGEEMNELDELKVEFNNVEAEIRARASTNEMEERINALANPGARRSQPGDAEVDDQSGDKPRAALSISGGLPVGTSKSTFGFRSMGDWAIAARKHKAGKHDPRILNAPTTFGQESVNEDGGFAVPPDFRSAIIKTIQAEDSLLGMTDMQQTSGNALTLPLDHVSPWDSSSGVQFYWVGEGQPITQSKPKLAQLETKVHKLAALVPITEELIQDAPALTSWLNSKVPDKLTSVINDVLITGDGVAKPLGMMNAACKVVVAKESGQTADTVVAANVMNMWSRAYGRMRKDAVWLINQDVEPELQKMVMPATQPGYPVYIPPGGLSAAPYATLYGRPVYTFESCQELGVEGDIMLVIPNQYLSVMKTGPSGLRTDVSIHLYFDSDTTAFRFVIRIGGQSYWPSAIARKNSTKTLSPIITLADRA